MEHGSISDLNVAIMADSFGRSIAVKYDENTIFTLSEFLNEISVGVTMALFNIIMMKYAKEEGVAAFTAINYIATPILKTAINNASNTILITAPVMRAKDAVYGKPSTLASCHDGNGRWCCFNRQISW